jgi:RimJ/RimL family protein N-acetyltransferase
VAGIDTPLKIAPVTLTGRFVRLEPLTSGHIDAMAKWAYDRELWKWTAMLPLDRSSLEAWINEGLAGARDGTGLPFVTVLIATGEVAGSTRFLNISARDGRMEIGATVVAPAFQRSVVNTEAKLLMLTHAFETLGATRVELKTHKNNGKSRRAIERIGAQFEGIHRKHMLHHDGTRRDTAWYSILDDEWPSVKTRLEAMLDMKR